MTFEEFKNSLPENVTSDRERLVRVCRAAGVEVPMALRFYIKRHTPKVSKHNPEPKETEYVVVPHPKGGRPFWVQKKDFGALIEGAVKFKDEQGL